MCKQIRKGRQTGKSSISTAEREFITVLKRKVFHQRFCYQLRDLVGEMNSLYEFFDCGRASSAKSLKKLIIDLVGNQICFSPSIGLHGSPLVGSCNWGFPFKYNLLRFFRLFFLKRAEFWSSHRFFFSVQGDSVSCIISVEKQTSVRKAERFSLCG